MKITDEMVNAADSVLSRVRPGINDGQIRLALEAAFAVRAKYTREQINEMIGRGEMFVDTNPEADWIAASEMACPHCGGSGHKDDVRPLSASPAGVVKPLDGEEYRRVMDAAIAAYEANTPPTYRYSATALCKAVEAAFSARIMSAIEPDGVKSWGEMQAEDCVLSIGSKRTCGHGTLGCVNHHAPSITR